MRRFAILLACLIAAAATLFFLRAHSSPEPLPANVNTLSAEEKIGGWKLLFDGKSVVGWRGYRQQVAPDEWIVENASLVGNGGGDLVTTDQYDNFELLVDWKIPTDGNSGIIYRCTEAYGACWNSGVEYQIYDDANQDARDFHACGSAFELYGPTEDARRPAGTWNTSRLICRGQHIEHWLNGKKVVEYEYASPDFIARVAKSKFKQWPEFGKATKGYIALQDHGARIEFRNIKIRVLPQE